jgi:hypothetical protein
MRPKCASCRKGQLDCHYLTIDESETRRQALLRENKALSALVEHLRTLPAATAQALLYELRNSTSPTSVLRRFEHGQIMQHPSETAAILSTMPAIHSKTELKLMNQHPVAYPMLNLS